MVAVPATPGSARSVPHSRQQRLSPRQRQPRSVHRGRAVAAHVIDIDSPQPRKIPRDRHRPCRIVGAARVGSEPGIEGVVRRGVERRARRIRIRDVGRAGPRLCDAPRRPRRDAARGGRPECDRSGRRPLTPAPRAAFRSAGLSPGTGPSGQANVPRPVAMRVTTGSWSPRRPPRRRLRPYMRRWCQWRTRPPVGHGRRRTRRAVATSRGPVTSPAHQERPHHDARVDLVR